MNKYIITLSCFCIFTITSFSQTEIGAEYQHGFGKSYNYNSIGGLYEGFSNTWKSSWQIGISYTFDITKKDGSSWGISAGYRYGFSYDVDGNLFGGARLTFSFLNDVDSKKHNIFTPSIEFGYHYTFNQGGKGAFTTPSLAFGYDIPMSTGKEAENDHEGALFIPRIAVGYRF
jgi:hypothetical protein